MAYFSPDFSAVHLGMRHISIAHQQQKSLFHIGYDIIYNLKILSCDEISQELERKDCQSCNHSNAVVEITLIIDVSALVMFCRRL